MPFQSEKQRRYMHANLPEIAQRWENDYANGGIMDVASSGNLIDEFENYNKGESVNVPKSFQARSHSTPVNLSYITDQEADILQTLKPDTPHDGPMGIPNYDDYDPTRGKYGRATSGATMSGIETGGGKSETGAGGRADTRALGYTPEEVSGIRGGAQAAAAMGQRRSGIGGWGGNILRGIMSIFGGAPGKVMSMLSRINPGKLRGWNEAEGRYNTQQEYEDARTNRRGQKRMDYLADRKSRGLGYGTKAYEELLGQGYSDTFQDAINADLESGMNVNEGPFATSHLQSLGQKMAPAYDEMTGDVALSKMRAFPDQAYEQFAPIDNTMWGGDLDRLPQGQTEFEKLNLPGINYDDTSGIGFDTQMQTQIGPEGMTYYNNEGGIPNIYNQGVLDQELFNKRFP